MNIPGINFDITEDDDEGDVIFRKRKSDHETLAISKSTGEILNGNDKLKEKQIGQNRKSGINMNNSNIGIKYKMELDVGGYRVVHTHYNDDGQEYEIYDSDGNYVTTAYSTSDLYEEIEEDKKRKGGNL